MKNSLQEVIDKMGAVPTDELSIILGKGPKKIEVLFLGKDHYRSPNGGADVVFRDGSTITYDSEGYPGDWALNDGDLEDYKPDADKALKQAVGKALRGGYFD